MAKSTRQYVFDGMELLPEGLAPFVEERLETSLKGHWQQTVLDRYRGLQTSSDGNLRCELFDERGNLIAIPGGGTP